MKKEESYKHVGEGSGAQAIEELRNEIISPLENDIQKLRDPVVLASIMHTAATERENTNRLLKTLIEKLDQKFSEVETRISALEVGIASGQVTEEKALLLLHRKTTSAQAPQMAEEELLLPEIDEGILTFVKEKRHVSAEEVRRRFGYRGKNAASSRLNRMFELGLLEKQQVGRVVVYSAKKL